VTVARIRKRHLGRFGGWPNQGDLSAISQVCAHHSQVIAPASYDRCPARPVPIAPFERSQVFVPADSAVRAARRFAADTLGTWDEDELIDDATLIVSELATNALQHARSPFQMSLRASGRVISIAVQDVSSVHPRRVDADAEGEGGRGIAVVVQLSSSWGTYATPDGKVVWSQLDRSLSDASKASGDRQGAR
jgi:anti-sigma regulatory factor (Ser/Thr protein kinase)